MLTIIVTTLFIALVLNILLKKLHFPTIIGYIATGTIIAYGFNLHSAVNNHELKELAEFGIVFLMFTIGLEFSLQHLKKMKYEVFVTGFLQVVITASITYAISYFVFSIPQETSLIISLAIALSSTAIVLKTLNENGEITRRYGQRALGILIFQDIAVIPILLIIGFMHSSSDNISSVLLEMTLSGLALVVLLWIIGKYLLEPFFNQIVETNSEELFVATILFLAIGASYLAHKLGFSYSLGAFVAGMLIAETKYKYQAESDLIPFRDLLLGIFFITVGMQINFGLIGDYIHIILLLLLAIFILKFIIIYALVTLRENRETSFKTALGLIQVGEFSLVIFELARTYELVETVYSQIMVVTIVISMILTSLLLKNLSAISDKFLKRNGVRPEPNIHSDGFKNHTIVLGFGEFARNVINELRERGEPYVVIENNIETYLNAYEQGESIIYGNAERREVLRNADIEKAKHIIVAIDNPKKLDHVCYTILTMMNSNHVIVKVHSQREYDVVRSYGIENVVVENSIASEAVLKLI
jgi:CPA2 family monovalent cation:H+ antiporter-2